MPIESEPGEAVVSRGLVILDGPGCTAVTMTPDAATRTAHRLLGAGAEALAAGEAGDAEPDQDD